MTKLYEKWILFNVNQLMRHMSVALATWLGQGIVEGKINWNSMWVALVAGAFFPTLILFLGKGIPTSEDDLKDETETKVETKVEVK